MLATAINQTRRVFTLYAFFVLLFLVGLFATFSNAFACVVESLTSGATLTEIESRDEMERALNADSAIIFADMPGSISSNFARNEFVEFVDNWIYTDASPNMQFFLFESSTPNDELRNYLDAWRESDHKLRLVGRIGMGEVVWIYKGRVLEVSDGGLTALELSLETNRLMSECLRDEALERSR